MTLSALKLLSHTPAGIWAIGTQLATSFRPGYATATGLVPAWQALQPGQRP